MPALAVRVHTAWPQDTPSAVNTPPRRPPPAVLLTVTAVSGPGVTMTRADTPRKARSEAVTRPIRPKRHDLHADIPPRPGCQLGMTALALDARSAHPQCITIRLTGIHRAPCHGAQKADTNRNEIPGPRTEDDPDGPSALAPADSGVAIRPRALGSRPPRIPRSGIARGWRSVSAVQVVSEPVSSRGPSGCRVWHDGMPGGSCRRLARPSTLGGGDPHVLVHRHRGLHRAAGAAG